MDAILTLDDDTLATAVAELCLRDRDLAAVVDRFGTPPLWGRAPGFPTLVHIMLEQQVSLASAKAAFDRLRAELDPLTPDAFLQLDDARLLQVGFSRQKTRYVRELSRAIVSGSLDLDGLSAMPDEAVRACLMDIVGIGPWTADIYLLMALRRPDVWPVSDMALATAVGEVKRLPRRPGVGEMVAIGEEWRPWRSVAARLCWLDYLGRRGRAI